MVCCRIGCVGGAGDLQGSKMEYEALAQGMESGKQVQLHHAMSGTDGVKQIGEQK